MRAFVIGVVFMLIAFTNQAQNLYSQQNLRQATAEELNQLLVKAEKTKKTGAILSIGGPITSVAGLAMFSASWAGNFGGSFTAGAGLIMFFGGIGATVVGLPILITGSSRIKRIKDLKANSSGAINIELVPCRFTNLLAQSSQPGVSIRIRF